MPRTFVWHPSRGPKKAPTFQLPKTGKVRIKQIRSGIGHPEKHRLTLRAMGLKHHQDVVVQELTPGLRGQINLVRHMIQVTPVEQGKEEKGKGKA
jgi:large subunit ribosomal protein L30